MANAQSSPYTNDEYTVGWICALPHEFAAAKGMLDEEHGGPQTIQADADDNSYFLGSIGKFKVVIACLPLHQIGPTSAASAAKEMLFTFPKIRVGLLVGIGAGIPDEDGEPDIRLGDIVISSSPKTGGVVVYDFGKQLADGSFESLSVLNRPPRSLAAGLSKLQAQHEMHGSKVSSYIDQMLDKYPHMRRNGYDYPGQSRDRLFRPDYAHVNGKTCRKCEESGQIVRETRGDDVPVIHYGTIASGSMVIKDPIKRDNIRDKHGAICLEMEAAGLVNIFPCVVIRGISDYADSHKNDGWQKYAAAAAAACAKEFLECVPSKSIDAEPAAKELLKQVREEVKEVTKFTTSEQTRQILEWITPLDFDDYQNDLLGRRQEGTGLWFLNSEEFTQWMSRPNQTLFCPGIPGAGKTFISSIVVEHLKVKWQGNPQVQTCSIFFGFQSNHRSNLDLLLSLLRQIAVKGSKLLKNIEDMHACHTQKNTRPPLAEVRSEIIRTSNSYEMIFIVIDALDEYYSSTSEELHTFLSTLFDLQKDAAINILATSRFNSGIMSRFETCLQKEIRAQEDDIQAYLNSRIPLLLEKKISRFPNCENDVRREVTKSANGMFILVKIHMDNLMGHITRGDLEEALINLPHGDTRLQVAYDETIKRIKSQHQSRCQMALRILLWLTFCKRDLFARELQHALGTRPGDKDLDRRFLPELEIIDSLCAGLVVYDQRSGIFRLAHYTTKEYLIHHPDLHNAETEILQTSITYLSFDGFGDGRSSTTEEYMYRRREYPLHEYCAQNWAQHASQAMSRPPDHTASLIDLLLKFLNKEWNIQAAWQAMMVQRNFSNEILETQGLNRIPRRLTKVHFVAYVGLSSIISRYISSGEDLEAVDSAGMTPLAYAAENGHIEVTELLIQSNRVHINVQDNEGRTPLSLATGSGHKDVVEALLRCGACPNTKGRCDWSPLCEAAYSGRADIIQVLLDNGATIDHQCADGDWDIKGGTPLMISGGIGDKKSMWVFLNRGADPEFPNKNEYTLIDVAAETGDQELVDYLLKRGVSVGPRGDYGTTPLWCAVTSGHATIVKSLLDAGCDVNWQNSQGETYLMIAIGHSTHEDVVTQLIEHGSNLSLQDQKSETALFYAARGSNPEIVEALLEHGANPNVLNNAGETPLFASATTGHEGISKLLLDKGVDPFVQNGHQQTALFLAANNGHMSILGCLIGAGLDVNAEDDMGNTAIFYSAGNGKTDATQMLLERGASVYHRNVLGETPLFYAARKGRLEACELLIQSHAEPNVRNILMQTPLMQAAAWALSRQPLLPPDTDKAIEIQVLTMLIERGADPSPVDLATHVEHLDAWEFLRSASVSHMDVRQVIPTSCLRFCEAARQIWGSRIEGYSEDQVLDFLNRVVYSSSSYRELWTAGNNAPLLFAVRSGDTKLLRTFFKSWESVDNSNELVQQTLMEAVELGHRNIVTLVLNGGPGVRVQAVDIPSLTLRAAEMGHVGILKLLMTENEGPDGPIHAVDTSSLMLCAAEKGQVHILEFLLTEKGVDLQTTRKALVLAFCRGNPKTVRLLLNNGATPDSVALNAHSALHGAVLKDATQMVELLLQQDININARDRHGRTALIYAVQRGQMAIVKMLLEAGADPNVSEDDIADPILYEPYMKDLMTRNIENQFGGLTSLFFAAGDGNDAIVKLLLYHGAIPDAQDIFGERPIDWAAGNGFEVIVKMLLEKGANANQLDHASPSPLFWALGGEHIPGLKWKVNRGSEKGVNYVVGDTFAVVDLLLRNGSDPNVVNEDGLAPLSFLIQRRLYSRNLVRLLLRAGCNPNTKDRYGRTPLMGGIVNGWDEFVEELLDIPGLDLDATDCFGRTALMEAITRNKSRILALLSQVKSKEETHSVPATRGDEINEYGDLVCNICQGPTSSGLAYHCSICHKDDFDICPECKKLGATCLDSTHMLTQGDKQISQQQQDAFDINLEGSKVGRRN